MRTKYLDFLKLRESDTFEIEDTDSEDTKIAKQSLEDLKKEIADYNSKKTSLESIYKNMNKDDEAVGLEAKKIIMDGDKANSFLSNYANILSNRRKVNGIQNAIDENVIQINDLKNRIADSESNEIKEKMNKSIVDKENANKEKMNQIKEIEENIKEMESELKDKLSEKENQIKEWIAKI